VTGALLVLLAGVWLAAGPAQAQGKRVVQQYAFVIADVRAADGVPPELAGVVQQRLVAAVDAHDRLATLPPDAPDPAADPDGFTAYVKRHKLTPYRVTVEVTDHAEETSDGPRGQRLSASVALRMFGETMPVRVMAFSATGAATIKLDVGKTVRPRDVEVARRDAIAQAVDDALAEAIQRLDEKAGKKKPGKAKKKR
jgi:hypothetical protein